MVNSGSNTTSLIQNINFAHQVFENITVGRFPAEVAINPNTHEVYVTTWMNTVSVFVVDNFGRLNSNISTISFPPDSEPNGIAVDTNVNRIYVAESNSSIVSVIDGNINHKHRIIDNIFVGGHPKTNLTYVTEPFDNRVSVINDSTDKVVYNIAIFDKAISLNSSDYDTLWNKAYSLSMWDDYKSAIPIFAKILKLNQTDSAAYNDMGVAIFNIDSKNKTALQYYDKALKINSTDENAWFNRGAFLQANSDFKGAISSYEKALQLNPNDKDARENLMFAKDQLLK